ncbi:MAG: hypothetical protein RL139_1257 [Gemmatimonadota bacterium]|jgi:hypothetical protein
MTSNNERGDRVTAGPVENPRAGESAPDDARAREIAARWAVGPERWFHFTWQQSSDDIAWLIAERERLTREREAAAPRGASAASRVLLLPHPETEETTGDDLGCEECGPDERPETIYRCVVCYEQVCLQHNTTQCLDQGGAHAWVLRGAQGSFAEAVRIAAQWLGTNRKHYVAAAENAGTGWQDDAVYREALADAVAFLATVRAWEQEQAELQRTEAAAAMATAPCAPRPPSDAPSAWEWHDDA